MKQHFFALLRSENDSTTIIIRFLVGYVFLMEGIQKFVYAEKLGVGRFIKIGIPYPEIMAPFVGSCEILFAILVGIGLMVRMSSIIFIIIMFVALISTKYSVLISEGILTFSHQARNDLSMLFCSFYLVFKGSGKWAVDQKLAKEI
jgi:putative oxidoreductase